MLTNEAECIHKQLLNSRNFLASKSVSVYVSFRGEVPTHEILEACFAAGEFVLCLCLLLSVCEGKNVFVPLIEGKEPMKMLQIHSHNDLEGVKVFKSVEILQPTRPETRLEGK